MDLAERYELRIKELQNKIIDLKDSLDISKEKAFSAHEFYVSSGKKDSSSYDSACEERERIKDELTAVESELNNMISRSHESEFRKHENEQTKLSFHGRNLMNLAFICLGLAFALIIKRLLS